MRRNKYNVSPPEQRTYKGKLYDSKAEMHYARQLDLDPTVIWWLRQTRVELGEDDYCRIDFLVCRRIDFQHAIYGVDVKGVETAKFRRIRKLWKKYGPFPLHVVKGGATSEVITKENQDA